MYFCAVASVIAFTRARRAAGRHSLPRVPSGDPQPRAADRAAAGSLGDPPAEGRKARLAGLEVLFGKRTPNASFMPNVWVFPGGAVDSARAEPTDDDYTAAAIRELEEEASVTLDTSAELVPFSRWITPREVKVRYDTRFYLALAPAHCCPEPDRRGDRRRRLVRATAMRSNATRTARCCSSSPRSSSSRQLADSRTVRRRDRLSSSREVEPILPRVDRSMMEPSVLLPGDPGYWPARYRRRAPAQEGWS